MISLHQSAQPTETAPNGYAYRFEAISQGMAASVTVSVPGAPPTATWAVSVSGQTIATLAGPNAVSGVYLAGGQALMVAGTSSTAPGTAVMVGELGRAEEVPVTVPVPAPGATNIGAEVQVAGNVTATISGTTDVNVTNASIPISGSVSADITNATLTVQGTVDIAAGQVVEVTNEPSGSLTVAGTVDINSVTGTVTIDANGSDITVDQVPQGKLIATIPANSTTFSIPATSIGAANTLTLIQAPSTLGATDVDKITSVVQTNAPNASLPFGLTSAVINGVFGYLAAVVDLVDGSAVTVNFLINTVNAMYVYASSGIDSVVASVSNLPLVAVQGANSSVALQVRPGHTVRAETVANPAAGANWSYTLQWPARLRHIGAVFATDATVVTRYPYVVINPGTSNGNAFDAMPAGNGLAANSSYNFSWQAGSGFVPYLSQGANGWVAAIPDYGVLPAGTVIESGVSGLQAADQWSAINLQLAPA